MPSQSTAGIQFAFIPPGLFNHWDQAFPKTCTPGAFLAGSQATMYRNASSLYTQGKPQPHRHNPGNARHSSSCGIDRSGTQFMHSQPSAACGSHQPTVSSAWQCPCNSRFRLIYTLIQPGYRAQQHQHDRHSFSTLSCSVIDVRVIHGAFHPLSVCMKAEQLFSL